MFNKIWHSYWSMVVSIHRRMIDLESGVFQDMYDFEETLWTEIQVWADNTFLESNELGNTQDSNES